jgi:hypothetical protein
MDEKVASTSGFVATIVVLEDVESDSASGAAGVAVARTRSPLAPMPIRVGPRRRGYTCAPSTMPVQSEGVSVPVGTDGKMAGSRGLVPIGPGNTFLLSPIWSFGVPPRTSASAPTPPSASARTQRQPESRNRSSVCYRGATHIGYRQTLVSICVKAAEEAVDTPPVSVDALVLARLRLEWFLYFPAGHSRVSSRVSSPWLHPTARADSLPVDGRR